MKAILIHTAKKILPWVVGLALLYWVLTSLDWLPSPADWFRPKPLTIAETNLIINNIKQIAELQTASLYAEIVVDSSTVSTGKIVAMGMQQSMFVPIRPAGTSPVGKRLVLIVKGTVIAGVDMTAIDTAGFFVAGDSISIIMPKAKILDVLVNPGQVEIFSETGYWDAQAVAAVKAKAQQKLLQEASQKKLVEKAQANTRDALFSFFQSAGFTKINILSPQ